MQETKAQVERDGARAQLERDCERARFEAKLECAHVEAKADFENALEHIQGTIIANMLGAMTNQTQMMQRLDEASTVKLARIQVECFRPCPYHF